MTAPQRLTDRKRIAIIDAAIAEFRANGFESTSMDKIAATAGVSKRTVYNHFPGKDELFAEILKQLWDASFDLMDVAYAPGQPMREQLTRLVSQKMAMLADQNFLDLARVAIAETIHSPERAQAMVARLGEREEGVTRWIRAAQQDGKLKPCDPVFAAHLLQGQVKAFAFWPQVTMGRAPLSIEQQQPVVDAAVDMFLAYFGK
jgi:TetR/AcrR family transcriptional regulator of autoinduction and epiphytic fitness